MTDSEWEDTLRVRQFQETIEAIYLERDSARGAMGTFAWFVEEVGELSRALRNQDRENMHEEFGDCFAWLASLASIHGIDLAKAASKYSAGCPRCKATPCSCPMRP
jgi:NTP pyrophosphatase (non-canonical NTP hydrolase)